MPDVLIELAGLFRKSASGKKGGARDFTIDYEKLLRSAGCADGAERELAETRLQLAERDSLGLVRIDRHPRSGIPGNVRIARDGGEEWLFAAVGEASPSSSRQDLACFFDGVAGSGLVPAHDEAWRWWFRRMASRARDGSPVLPFIREDPETNRILVQAMAGVLNWSGEAIVRGASTRICGDSKTLQKLEARLAGPLAEISGRESLEEFGILKKPRFLMMQGPLVLHMRGKLLDFSLLSGPFSLSEGNFVEADALETSAPLCLSVENEDTFMSLARANPGVLLIQTSFPGAATRGFLQRLPASVPCFHFGDTDPAGFDILRDLREKSGRKILPFMMERSTGGVRMRLDEGGEQTLRRLQESPLMEDLRPVFESWLGEADLGPFEQERFSVEEVLENLAKLRARPESFA